MPKLVVITSCSRPQNLGEIRQSIFGGDGAPHFDIEWHIVFDTNVVRELPVAVLEELGTDQRITLAFNRCGKEVRWRGYANANKALLARRGLHFWYSIVDDDNLLHPQLLARIHAEMHTHPAARGFIVSQWVGGTDFSGLDVRTAMPSNVGVGRIDAAQFVLHSDLMGNRLYPTEHDGDGRLIAELYHSNPDAFVFIDEVLSYYNKLRTPRPQVSLPRVLVVGRAQASLRSRAWAKWESDQLQVRCAESETRSVRSVAQDATRLRERRRRAHTYSVCGCGLRVAARRCGIRPGCVQPRCPAHHRPDTHARRRHNAMAQSV